MDTTTLHLSAITIGLFGGLSIFLYGMELMTSSLKSVAGDRMRNLLARMTTNRIKAVFAGAFITSVIQSSSVTTVLCVGFVTAGLMSLQQSIGIIMGASIGTTVTAQIVAFKVTEFALVAVTIGFVMNFFFPQEWAKRNGQMILGLGLVFFGMNLMGQATDPLRDYPPFIAMLRDLKDPLYAVLLSAGFTALVQSSSATTGVIIVLASQGLITLEQGIALVFGANIGTCVTALLASIGKPREAVRTALIHVAFNMLGVLLWFGFIDEVARLVRFVSPVAAGVAEVDRLAAETPRQIANAHTLFNVGNTLIFIWFTGLLARLVTRLVPDRPGLVEAVAKPKYLDPLLLDTPTLAFDRVRMETRRLADQVLPMVRTGPGIVMTGSAADLAKLERQDDSVDALHEAIVAYLGELSTRSLSATDSGLLHDYMSIAGYYEAIGDTLETNLVHAGRERLRQHVTVGHETRRQVGEITRKVHWAVQRVTEAMERGDNAAALEVIEAKGDINDLVRAAERHLADRLIVQAPNRLATYRMETELIENLKHVYYFAKRIAKAVALSEAAQTEAAEPAPA